MQEAKTCPLGLAQRAPVAAERLEQAEGRHNVGRDEFRRTVNRAIDMGFGREVQYRSRAISCQQSLDLRAIANVPAHEHMARIVLQRDEVAQIAGVTELVEIDDRLIARREPVENEIGADEAGASGDQEHALFRERKGANSITRWRPRPRERHGSRDTMRRIG